MVLVDAGLLSIATRRLKVTLLQSRILILHRLIHSFLLASHLLSYCIIDLGTLFGLAEATCLLIHLMQVGNHPLTVKNPFSKSHSLFHVHLGVCFISTQILMEMLSGLHEAACFPIFLSVAVGCLKITLLQ